MDQTPAYEAGVMSRVRQCQLEDRALTLFKTLPCPQSSTAQMNLRVLVTTLGDISLCADWGRWQHPETGDTAVAGGKIGLRLDGSDASFWVSLQESSLMVQWSSQVDQRATL